jgi:CheY-like chemotaxis protein
MAKILIVEDDPVVLRMYTRVFGFEGFEVETATNGQEGVDKTKLLKPDLVLLDVMLPEKSGLQYLDEVKADPLTQNIPVIVMTNLAGKENEQLVLEKGAIRCIYKSEVNPKQVVELVKEEMQRRQLPVAGQ